MTKEDEEHRKIIKISQFFDKEVGFDKVIKPGEIAKQEAAPNLGKIARPNVLVVSKLDNSLWTVGCPES